MRLSESVLLRTMRSLMIAVVVAALWLPIAHLVFTPDSPWHISAFWLTLIGKFMCYAILALAMDLIWGFGGILSLGQGLFFALGGYAFGMYLMREIRLDGVYKNPLPDFMVFLDWKEFPWYWAGSEHFLFALLLVVVAPALVAFIFGWLAFRSRIKGVYFSIITQALTFAAMLAFFRNDMGFGGNNGFTDFKRILGYSITAPGMRAVLYLSSAFALAGCYLLCKKLIGSRFGQVLTAVRDGESRLMFLGYRTLHFKLFAWTLAAAMSGIAGAMYVPQVGIINPSEMSPAQSIEVAIWTAVGGRATLIGPIIGAFAVNGAKSYFTVAFPQLWLFFLGAIFIGVTLFLPRGIAGLWQTLLEKSRTAR